MQNFVQPGHTITLTAPHAVASGGGALVGRIFGVASGTVESGAEGEFVTCGVFDLTKVANTVFTQGQLVYWDVSTMKVNDADSSDSYLIGVAIEAAGASDTTARVRLNGVSVI